MSRPPAVSLENEKDCNIVAVIPACETPKNKKRIGQKKKATSGVCVCVCGRGGGVVVRQQHAFGQVAADFGIRDLETTGNQG